MTSLQTRAGGLIARVPALPDWSLPAAICVASALALVILGTRLTFFNDDWYFLLQRPGLESHGGLDALLAPHNGHLVVLLTLIYRALVALFGLHSQLPFRIVLAGAVASVGGLVFRLVSRRTGRVCGLLAALVVVSLGPAWEDLLFFASLAQVGSLALGLAALLVIERDTRRRNAVACLLLVCAVSLSDNGLPFLAGAAIAIALRRRARQLWIVVVPALVFGIWWVSYGSKGPSQLSLANVERLPHYIVDSVSIGLASLSGLNRSSAPAALTRGQVLLVIVALGVVVWLLRGGRPSRGVLVFAGAGLVFWVLTGANYIPGREPVASRYQLLDGAFLILIAAELFRGLQLGRRATALLVLAVLAAVGSNLSALSYGFGFMRERSGYVKADLGALELARGVAAPNLWLVDLVAHDPYLSGVTAGRYFAETHAHGAVPFYSPERIGRAPSGQRQAADSVLATAYRLGLRRMVPPASSPRCQRLPVAGGGGMSDTGLSSRGAVLTNRGAGVLIIGVRRFAPSRLPVYVGFLAAGTSARLAIPEDRVTLPWHLVAKAPTVSPGALAVCPA